MAHDRVDAHFAGGLRSHADYATYLRGMHAFVSGVDAAVAHVRLSPAWRAWSLTARARWLQADLDALALAPMDAPAMAALASPDAAGEPVDGADAPDDATAAGAMYVVEGSALGAHGLLGHARRLGHDGERGAVFLTRHAQGEDGRRWPRFAASLGSDAFAHASRQAGMLRAASAAFAHADLCFQLAADAAGPVVDTAAADVPRGRPAAADALPEHQPRSPR